jgi:hypothetical protein
MAKQGVIERPLALAGSVLGAGGSIMKQLGDRISIEEEMRDLPERDRIALRLSVGKLSIVGIPANGDIGSDYIEETAERAAEPIIRSGRITHQTLVEVQPLLPDYPPDIVMSRYWKAAVAIGDRIAQKSGAIILPHKEPVFLKPEDGLYHAWNTAATVTDHLRNQYRTDEDYDHTATVWVGDPLHVTETFRPGTFREIDLVNGRRVVGLMKTGRRPIDNQLAPLESPMMNFIRSGNHLEASQPADSRQN